MVGVCLEGYGGIEGDDFGTDFDGELRKCCFVASALFDFHISEARVVVKESNHFADVGFGPTEGPVETFMGDNDAAFDAARLAVGVQFIAEKAWVCDRSEFVKEDNEVSLAHGGC